MVTLKSAREIERCGVAGRSLRGVLTELMKAAKAGMTTIAIRRLAERGIRDGGGIPTFKGYHGFTATICASGQR